MTFPGDEAIIRVKAYFTIHACDMYGEPVTTGGERFRIVFRGRSAPQYTLRDNGDGTYEGSYTASVSGEYEMVVLFDGKAIRGSPYRLNIKAGIAAPQLCESFGEGLTDADAGEKARFSLRAYDTHGNPKASGGDSFIAMLYGPINPAVPEAAALAMPPVMRFRMADQRSGMYNGSYTLTDAGQYLLAVQEETTGEQVANSPFRVTVHAGPLHPHNCTLTPIDPLCTTIAGEIAMVDVGLFDAFNNPLPHEAARSLRVRFASADPPSPDPRARRGGGGGGAAAPAGSDVVSAGFGGANAHAVGEWLDGGGEGPTALPPVTSHQQPGYPPSGHVLAYEEDESQQRPPPDPKSPRQTLGVSECKLKPVEINGRRLTRLMFRPTKATGSLRVGVLQESEPLGGKPLSWTVEPAETHPDACVVRGDGLGWYGLASECTAGEAKSLSVFCRDRYGNAITTGGDEVTAEIRGKHCSPSACPTVDLNTGEHAVTFTAHVGGVHELHIFVRGEGVRGSPFTLTVHAAQSSPTSCTVDTSQLNSVRVGVPAPFVITAFDRHRNRALKGGDPLRAVLRPPDGSREELTLEDRDDGSYHGVVICRQTGTHYLETLLETVPLAASPHTIVVEAGPPRAFRSTARADFLERAEGTSKQFPYDDEEDDYDGGAIDVTDDGVLRPPHTRARQLEAGEHSEIKLIATDEKGNYTSADPADWHVHLQRLPAQVGDGNASIRPLITRNDPEPHLPGSECIATLELKQSGAYAVSVTLRGEEVYGGPFRLTVNPGPIDARSSGVSERGVPQNGLAGQEGRMVLICRDEYGNQLLTGGNRLAVQLRCPSNGLAQRAAVSDQGDGSYLIRFRPEVACEHELHAWLLQRAPPSASGQPGEEIAPQPLGGMPYLLKVSPGALSCGMSGEPSSVSSTPRSTASAIPHNKAGINAAAAPAAVRSPVVASSSGGGSGGGGGSGRPQAALSVIAGAKGCILLQLRDAHGNARAPGGEQVVASLERPRDRSMRSLPESDARRKAAMATAASVEEELKKRGADDIVSEGGVRRGGGMKDEEVDRLVGGKGAINASHAESLAAAVRWAAEAPVTLLGEQHHPLPRPEVGSSKDGRVEVSFVPTRIERLLLHVAVQRKGPGGNDTEPIPLRGSPFAVDVLPAETSARKCEAFGDALHRAQVRQPTSFILLARDANGNRRSHGGDKFIVTYRGPCNPIARVHDRGDGTYRVTYVAAVSGVCQMAVTLGRQHVEGSPFHLTVDGPEKTSVAAVSSKGGRAAAGGGGGVRMAPAQPNAHGQVR